MFISVEDCTIVPTNLNALHSKDHKGPCPHVDFCKIGAVELADSTTESVDSTCANFIIVGGLLLKHV